MSFYEVKVVNRSGTVLAEFDADEGDGDTRHKATVEEVVWVLNEPGSCRIRIPVFHPAAPEVQALKREVQVWRNGSIIFWGVPVQRDYDASTHTVVWTCPGLLWYFTQRYFGPITTNYLTNPNFTTNLTGWTATGVTATHSTAIRLRGPGTAKLVAASSGDHYIEQTFLISTGGVGVVLFLTGWYWVDPADPIVGPAFEERGLYIDSPNCLPDGSPSWEPITMNAPAGQPQRCPEVELHLPASLTNEPVTVRCYAGEGTIHWGALSVTALESVSSEPGGTDVTEMMRRIVDYAQNGTGKSSVNMTTSTPAAGVTEILAYQFADLGNIFGALQTYPARGLADYEVVITSTTRVFTTYAPRKGSLKSLYALSVPGTDVLAMGYRLDGQQTASKVIRRGSGDGPDREMGVATDTSLLDGLVLESVGDAPPEVNLDGLDKLAETDLERLRDVVALPDLMVAAAGFLGNVVTGDTVPVTIDWGDVQEAVDRRVVRLALNPLTDTVAVGFNVE